MREPARSGRTQSTDVVEIEPQLFSVLGDLGRPDAEISGMAWHGDQLILLPQYPDFAGLRDPRRGFVYSVAKAEVLQQLDRARPTLQPRPIPFRAPGLSVLGFEGFEAIAFDGDDVYLTIEASAHSTRSLLVKGRMTADRGSLIVEPADAHELPSQSGLGNVGDEAATVVSGLVLTIHEANGEAVNPSPFSRRFGLGLEARGTVPFPRIEYRVTDATAADGDGFFWVMNYFYPGSPKLAASSDPIAELWGRGESHARLEPVERLLLLRLGRSGVELAQRPPIQLRLRADGTGRNWEAIARLDERGFLIATDRFPRTLIAFVPSPS